MPGYDESALELLSALAEPTRWRILKLLRQKQFKSITLLGKTLHITRTAAAKHVEVLEKVNLVSRKKRGKYHGIEINHDLWEKIQLFLTDTV